MDRKRIKFILFSLFLFFLSLLHHPPCYGQDKETYSTKDLQELVNQLEDPKKREALVKDLKILIQLKEAGTKEKEALKSPEKKEREALLIENLFGKFDSLSERVFKAAGSTASLLTRSPEAFTNIKSFFAQPENRSRFFKLLGTIAGSILIALIIGIPTRKLMPSITEKGRRFASRLAIGLGRVVLRLIPSGALLISLFVLFKFFPSFPVGHSLILIFFTVLFFYRMAIELSRVLLSVDEVSVRVLDIGDESANYYWVWVLRFTNYTALYVLVTRILLISGITSTNFSFIRGLLLLLFPFMISVFLLQIAREIRTKFESSRKNQGNPKGSSNKIAPVIVRYWAVLAIGYSWAIFLFLIIHYEKGFYYLFSSTVGTVFTVGTIFLALWILNWLFKKFFAINEKVKTRFPGLEEKTNRYIILLRKVFKWILIIIGLGTIAQVWGIPVAILIGSKTGSLIILRAVAIMITLGVVVAVIETGEFLKTYLLKPRKGQKKKEVSQKRKTLVPMINTAVRIAAGFIGGIIILDQFGVNTTPILAGAGIVGLAVGFGSQTLVKDLINGLFILFEDSIRVGDYVDLGKNEGIVEAIGLRTVKLRDVSGNVHVVPNSSIDTLTNMTKEFSRAVIDIGVAYGEDVDEVMEILREIGEEMRQDPAHGKNILEPIEIFGLQKFDDSAVVIRARLTTKPLTQWGLKREFNRRVKKVFDQRGIEIPFPHRTIYMGEPKKGSAPPINVHLKEEKGPQ